jgi:hypothetical protein
VTPGIDFFQEVDDSRSPSLRSGGPRPRSTGPALPWHPSVDESPSLRLGGARSRWTLQALPCHPLVDEFPSFRLRRVDLKDKELSASTDVGKVRETLVPVTVILIADPIIEKAAGRGHDQPRAKRAAGKCRLPDDGSVFTIPDLVAAGGVGWSRATVERRVSACVKDGTLERVSLNAMRRAFRHSHESVRHGR